MIKDLTTLKWKKNIYYVSEDIIFDISSKKKYPDLDDCGTYLIDLDKAPTEIKNAKDSATLDLSKNPEVFVDNVPYIKLKFIAPNGKEIDKIFPLQYLIEEGDKFIDGKAIQEHPDVFDEKYVNKFNQDVFDFIKKTVEKKADFDPKNVDLIMNALPDWLTMGIEYKYMTETYIDKYFLKGQHYDSKLAIKGATSDNDVYQFRGAVIGIGLDAREDEYVPINIWQKETIESFLKALYAERTVDKYNKCVQNEVSALSVDSMENIAQTIKNPEMGFNKKSLKTFMNVQYRDHDCDGIVFESVAAADDVDTWYEYQNHKDDAPILNFEEIIAEDKALVEQYIQNNFENPSEVHKYWWEVDITMSKYYTDPDAYDNKIETMVDVFSVAYHSNNTVLMIYHEGDSRMVAEFNDIWVGDNNLYDREEQIVKTFNEAYRLMLDSEFDKVQSRQCAFRAQLGPQGGTIPPQFVFGNVHSQLYVNSQTGEVLNYSPVFPEQDGDKLNGTAEDIRSTHHQLINNRYNLNYWCQSNGAFIAFMDDEEFNTSDLYEVDDIFKIEATGAFIQVAETSEEQNTQEVDGSFETMPDETFITLEEAANIVLEANKAPHSELWGLINDNGTIKYKFGVDANAVFVNAITGQIIN